MIVFVVLGAPGLTVDLGQGGPLVALVFAQAARQIGQPVGGGAQPGRGVRDLVVMGFGQFEGLLGLGVGRLRRFQIALQLGAGLQGVLDLAQAAVHVEQAVFQAGDFAPGAVFVLAPGFQPQDVAQQLLALGRSLGGEGIRLALLEEGAVHEGVVIQAKQRGNPCLGLA